MNDALHVAEFPHGGATAFFISARTPGQHLRKVFHRVMDAVAVRDAKIVFQYLFGGRGFYPQAVSAIERLDWPLTLVQGDACSGTTIAGTQFIALSGADLHPVKDGDRTAGHWYDTADARYCLLGDIRADDLTLSRADQAYAVFVKIEMLLQQAGMDFTDIARTWIYLRNLLDWYGEFNAVRNRFYQERGVFEKTVPASTGIGAGASAGEAINGSLLAVKPRNESVKVFAVPSPLQGPALDYQSSFSRAVEIQHPGSRFLTISGTASIDPKGRTAHAGDAEKQIALTMEVVHGILKSREMDWGHVVRAIAYFKDIREAHLLEEYCIKKHVPALPVVLVHADVCRSDLQFEIEVDAVEATSNASVDA